jgi:hypothetical protein
MFPSAMLEGKNDFIYPVENIAHVRVCVHFVFDVPLTEVSVGEHTRFRI